jgi:hypothetical protein
MSHVKRAIKGGKGLPKGRGPPRQGWSEEAVLVLVLLLDVGRAVKGREVRSEEDLKRQGTAQNEITIQATEGT